MRYQISMVRQSLALIAVGFVASGALAPQSPAPSTRKPAGPWRPPRAADGHADLQGIWNYSTITPLERPNELAGKEFLSEQEAAAIAKREADNRSRPNPADLEEARRTPGFGADLEAPLAYEFRIWWRSEERRVGKECRS